MMMVAWRTSSPRVLDGPKLVAQRSNAFLLPRLPMNSYVSTPAERILEGPTSGSREFSWPVPVFLHASVQLHAICNSLCNSGVQNHLP